MDARIFTLPPFPEDLLSGLCHSLQNLLKAYRNLCQVITLPPLPPDMVESLNTLQAALHLDYRSLTDTMTRVLKAVQPAAVVRLRRPLTDVWSRLERDYVKFWFITGQTPQSLADICMHLQPLSPTQRKGLTHRDTVLMTFMWLRQYCTLHMLSFIFDLSLSYVQTVTAATVMRLHRYLAPLVRWHDDATWRSLAGSCEGFPTVVGYIDGTVLRISRPTGELAVILMQHNFDNIIITSHNLT